MTRPLLSAGRLRHRIQIEERIETQDSDTGDIIYVWQIVNQGEADEWSSLPAAIEPLSAREFIAAASTQAGVTAKITIRRLAGLTAKHRAVDEFGRIWNIRGVLADPVSGLEWQTLPCEEGVNDG